MQENLQEMINNLNDGSVAPPPVMEEVVNTTTEDASTESENVTEEVEEVVADDATKVMLTNFYDWFESNSGVINNVSRVKAEVSNIDSKDSIIFKIQKGSTTDESAMQLISFYNPTLRPVVNLPPVYMNVFKNDTFEVLHQYNDEIFIKSYGVKAGLILVLCANVDGKVIPYQKIKIKKDATSFNVIYHEGIVDEIRNKLQENVDLEAVQLLYKQAIKHSSQFTTKESTVDWFIKKYVDVIDINHLLKIDNVLINVI
jgi:hypothetical protein